VTETRKKKRPLPGERPSRFRAVWIGIAGLYLVTVWLDGVGSTWPAKVTPRAWLYFSQVAALFVNAAPKVIDYRAEGWSCSDHRWTEIDVRPFFPIDAETKENRFQRGLQFYRKNRTVMRALEDFVIQRQNASAGTRVGGVRFSSLRIAYPAPGQPIAPFVRRPLATYSAEERHAWYWTPNSGRTKRCGSGSDSQPPDASHDDDSDHGKDSKDTDRELDP